MTHLRPMHWVRASAPIGLYCPTCAGTDLWCEEMPRGDYPVACLSCGDSHQFAVVEERSLERLRCAIRQNVAKLALVDEPRLAA
jgi:hypothetical protein